MEHNLAASYKVNIYWAYDPAITVPATPTRNEKDVRTKDGTPMCIATKHWRQLKHPLPGEWISYGTHMQRSLTPHCKGQTTNTCNGTRNLGNVLSEKKADAKSTHSCAIPLRATEEGVSIFSDRDHIRGCLALVWGWGWTVKRHKGFWWGWCAGKVTIPLRVVKVTRVLKSSLWVLNRVHFLIEGKLSLTQADFKQKQA